MNNNSPLWCKDKLSVLNISLITLKQVFASTPKGTTGKIIYLLSNRSLGKAASPLTVIY